MKKIIILGATGSIGKQSIDIINQRDNKELFAFSFNSNINEAINIINNNSSVKFVSTTEENIKILKNMFKTIQFLSLNELAQIKCYLVIIATVGFSALEPTIHAIQAKNDIALANKECIVAGGSILFKKIKESNVNFYTIDSEHNAISQCLNGENIDNVKSIILTASGGPFLNEDINEIKIKKIDDVINHPNWSMGIKISIDSANMANKVLELIEAKYLFNQSINNIKIVIQPTSIVHSMVEFIDGSTIMQMSNPSMYLPISYAIEKNNRKEIKNYEYLNISNLTKLKFINPDIRRYPILDVIKMFNDERHDLFIRFNALNEYFNYLFRNNVINFTEISENILKNMKSSKKDINVIDDIFNYHYNTIREMEKKYEYNFNNN